MNPAAKKMYGVLAANGIRAVPLSTVDADLKCSCKKDYCRSAGKHPLYHASWKWVASRDPEKVTDWFESNDLNVGATTGYCFVTRKHLIVIDFDDPEKEKLWSTKLPKTFRYKTGRGGFHYWFWSQKDVGNSVSLLDEHVDIRGAGGYVVIPPSRHVLGTTYTVDPDENEFIADLPAEVEQALLDARAARQATRKKRTKPTSPGAISGLLSSWSRVPIADIRKKLADGMVIPMGVRNATVHRLLSSDRARGVLRSSELYARGLDYVSKLEDPASFDDYELQTIVKSVMKYPVYNNSFENVNKNYALWLKKHKKPMKPGQLAQLQQADTAWFGSLKLSEKGVSLAELTAARKEFLLSKGITQQSVYKTSILGTKLREMGFKRKKTKKNNLWLISVHNPLELGHNGTMATTSTEESVATTQEPAAPEPRKPTVTKQKVTIKRKVHPNDWKYPGQQNSENLKLTQVYVSSLSKEEMEQMDEGSSFQKDPARTASLFAEILPNDEIGLDYAKYNVVEKGDSILELKELNTRHLGTRSVDLAELDFAIQTDRAEILRRDGKFYGATEDEEVTLKVIDYSQTAKPETSENQPTSEPQPKEKDECST